MAARCVLILEDDPLFAEILSRIVAEEGFDAAIARSGEVGLQMLDQVRPALILCDIGLPGMDGISFLRVLAERDPAVLSIVVSGQATVEKTVEAMRAGAFDVIQKTADTVEIQLQLRRAMETADLKRQVRYLKQRDREFCEIIGASPVMAWLRKRIEEVAASPVATVLIAGETGTGKELVARAIHRLSDRAQRPLVAVNSAAVSETLMESEFFGHEKGSFTGALRSKIGLFELAHRGTLFLDEIGELDQRLQVKLLRVLEERVVRRVGGSTDIPIDIRFISATNRDLEAEAAAGRFREDLLYRVNVFRIEVPPLRERGEDILQLARHFLDQFAHQLGKRASGIDPTAERLLMSYDYPGNVRQLRNLIEQAAIVTKHGDPITVESLQSDSSQTDSGLHKLPAAASLDTLAEQLSVIEAQREALELQEQILVKQAMTDSGGKVTKAADMLGISRFALQRRLKRFQKMRLR